MNWGYESVRKLFLMSILLLLFLFVSSCKNESVKQIKADTIDIGLGQSLYEGYNKVDKETVQSLVKNYNQIEYIGQTNEQINYEKAITITFIYNDQISGTIVLEDTSAHSMDQSSGDDEHTEEREENHNH